MDTNAGSISPSIKKEVIMETCAGKSVVTLEEISKLSNNDEARLLGSVSHRNPVLSVRAGTVFGLWVFSFFFFFSFSS